MSYYDYRVSGQITSDDPPFTALIMAAMRQADNASLEALKAAFPRIWQELQARYHAPGGRLAGEEHAE